MSWNYRIVRWPLTPEEAELVGYDHFFALHSVYYDKDGVPDGVSEKPAEFVVDGYEGFEGIIAQLQSAIGTFNKHGVLDAKDIKGLKV